MKKLLLVLIPVLTVIILVVVFVLNSRKAEAVKFMLIKESGSIEYKIAGEYTKLDDDEIELPSGSFVKTGDGVAHILLQDNSLISLDNNTEIQLKIENEKTDLLQLAGNTWNRIEKLSSGNGYQVQTPTTIAAVRGTEFGVLVPESEQSDIFVLDSTVKVGKLKLENGVADFADSNDLEKGRWYKYDHGETEINDIPEELTQSNFYKKNLLLNDILNNTDKSRLKDLLRNLLTDNELQAKSDTLGEATNQSIPGLTGFNPFDFTEVCGQITTPGFLEYRSLLNQNALDVPGYAEYFTSTRNYLDLLVDSCADNIIDIAEQEQLRSAAEAMQNSMPVSP